MQFCILYSDSSSCKHTYADGRSYINVSFLYLSLCLFPSYRLPFIRVKKTVLESGCAPLAEKKTRYGSRSEKWNAALILGILKESMKRHGGA